jgi:hypothetical protein
MGFRSETYPPTKSCSEYASDFTMTPGAFRQYRVEIRDSREVPLRSESQLSVKAHSGSKEQIACHSEAKIA